MFDGDAPLVPVPAVSAKVGGILQRFVHEWRDQGCSPWVLEVLSQGYKIRFLEPPPLRHTPIYFGTLSPDKRKIRSQLVQDLLGKAAIEVVQSTSSPAFYSLLFVVPKASGQWRPVIDLSTLNTYVDIPTFRMDTLDRIKPCLTSGSWAASLDLQDAYLQIPIHTSHRKFLRFPCDKSIYQFRALPFGLSTAPWLFTKVMDEVKKMLHKRGIQVYMYLDDWLVVADSERQCATHIATVRQLCLHLGLVVNDKKSTVHSDARFCLSGFSSGSTQLHVLPDRRQKSENPGYVSEDISPARGNSLRVASTIRTVGVYREGCTSGKTTHPRIPVSSMPTLLGLQPIHEPTLCENNASYNGRAELVDAATQYSPRNRDSATGTTTARPHRRLAKRMGRTHSRDGRKNTQENGFRIKDGDT